MICRHCQTECASDAIYCSRCGARLGPIAGRKQLMRSRSNARIGGVCGGLGEYFDVDPTVVRVLWVALSVIPGCLIGGALAYVALWIIIPRAPEVAAAGATLEPQTKAS